MVFASASKWLDDEALWQRRLQHRMNGVSAVKATELYAGSRSRPRTPDPFDRSVSKRRWEASMQAFRLALREAERLTPLEWLGGSELKGSSPTVSTKSETAIESCGGAGTGQWAY